MTTGYLPSPVMIELIFPLNNALKIYTMKFYNIFISLNEGYLPSEVKGKSAFNFFYAEDLPWTTMALRHSKYQISDLVFL